MTFSEVVQEARRLTKSEGFDSRTNPYGDHLGRIVDENAIAGIVSRESGRTIIAVQTRKNFPNHYGQVIVWEDRALIELSGDINQCWKRFALVKELMHVLHPCNDGTIDKMETRAWLARDSRFIIPNDDPLDAETSALCLAIELLVPWKDRGCISDWHHNNHQTNFELAKKLLVPMEVIGQYFELGYAEKSNQFNSAIGK